MKSEIFIYQYSASQSKEVESIRKKYEPKETNKLERLRLLDKKVQEAGTLESLCMGIVGILIFGLALCFALLVFGSVWWPSIPLFIVSLFLMIPAYPLFKHIHKKKKEMHTPEILKLSDELLKK